MKKIFVFAAIAVSSVVACQKEISTVPEGNYTVRASREPAVDTRSTVSDEGAFAWSVGDAIGLWNGNNFIKLTTNASGATADFSGTMVSTAQSYAVFPFALNAKVESGIVKVTLPSSYEWKEGETNSPMLAECGENPTSLSFKHLGGLVKVTVKNVPAEAVKFVLTADKDIAGEYSVEDDGDAKVIKAAGTEANNSVAFSFKAGTATNMAFYVPVPVGEYKFTVALQKEDGTQLWSYEGSSANTVIRAKFILMPELTITSIPATGEGGTTSAAYLQELLNKGGTIKLDSDYVGDFTIPANVKVELNLNGHKITNVSGDTFTVGLGGELVVNGEGTVDNVSHGRSCIYNNGTVTLNGGKYTRSKEASTSTSTSGGNSYYNILNHGDLTINEGVEVYSTGAFSSLIDNGYYNYTDSNPRSGYVDGTNNAAPSLTIKGGKFSGGINTIKNDDGAALTIKGGDFSNTTQACVQNNNVATISGGTFKPAQGGHSVESIKSASENNKGETSISGGTFDGPLYTYDGGSFKISGGTFKDMSVEAGKAAGNIIFASDYELASPVILKSGSLTVDLGSKTLVASKSSTIEDSSKGTCTTAFEVKKGTALTVKNGYIGNADSNIFYGVHSSGGDVTLESVTFGENVTYAFNGGGKLDASGCTFKGWLSGWNKGGSFKNCTFTVGKAYYPAAICYGNTLFESCSFFKNDVDPDEYGNGGKRDDDEYYRCNYVVSACQPTTTVDFNGCKFIDANDKDAGSLTSDKYPYISGWGDGKTAIANIKVDGTVIAIK